MAAKMKTYGFLPFLLVLLMGREAAAAKPTLSWDVNKTKMSEVLADCGSNDPLSRAEECDHFFYSMVMVIYDGANAPNNDPKYHICLPDVRDAMNTFGSKLIAWLKQNQSAQSLSVVDAIRPAAVAIYGCQK